jgi:hypothetical protein
VIVAAVIFRVALPVLVSVTFCAALPPTLTVLKLRDDGLMLSCGCTAAPVPLNAIVAGELGALLVIVTLPVALPAAVGANVTENVVFPPAAIVVGCNVMV